MTPGLEGLRVLVTRPEAGELRSLLEAAGATVASIPVIRLVPLLTEARRRRLVDEVGAGAYDLVVFTSANAVRQLALVPPPAAAVGLFAIGPGTSAAARALGWDPAPLPERYVAEALAEVLVRRGVTGKRVLLPRAAGARPVLPRELMRAGALVDSVDLYAAEPDPASAAPLAAELVAGAPDWVTFTSSSTVTAFIALAGATPLPPTCRIGCIGPVTAERAREAGMRPAVEARVHTLGGLVAAMVSAPATDNRAANGLS